MSLAVDRARDALTYGTQEEVRAALRHLLAHIDVLEDHLRAIRQMQREGEAERAAQNAYPRRWTPA